MLYGIKSLHVVLLILLLCAMHVRNQSSKYTGYPQTAYSKIYENILHIICLNM
jgi:hypothetical protein